jgi:dsRNA-specific ribonuclease
MGMLLGMGHGPSKKTAQQAAAEAALLSLTPASDEGLARAVGT